VLESLPGGFGLVGGVVWRVRLSYGVLLISTHARAVNPSTQRALYRLKPTLGALELLCDVNPHDHGRDLGLL